MRWRDNLLLLPTSLVLASFSDVIPTKDCPFLGPAFPSGFDVTKSNAIRDAKEAFPNIIQALFDSGTIPSNESSFSLDVFSTSTNASLYSYFHAAPGLNGTLTAGVLNDETIMRIGSVSKLYTAYALVVETGIEVFDHPVTKYLPELAGNSRQDALTKIIWEDVTVGALASMQGGAGGVPSSVSLCYLAGNCTVDSFLELMKNKRPVTSPWETPAYSDAGYATLGRVLERITGLKYEEAIHKILSVPLGLNSSTTTLPAPDGLNALAITEGETAWGMDAQMTAPSGGIYANNADLRRLGLSILNNELLSEAVTKQWTKPRGHTSSLTMSVGAPWEIHRLTIPVTPGSNRTRVIDLYTKAGGNPPYGALLALSPDHGIGFSVLVAGPSALSDRWPLRDALAGAFVPAAELAAEANAADNFVGTFVDESVDGANITLTTDEGLPGLGMKFFYGGEDYRVNVTSPLGGDVQPEIRIFPSGLVSAPSEDGVVGMVFNALAYGRPPSPRADIEGGDGLFDYACTGWMGLAFFYIYGHAIDQFTLYVKEGRLVSIEYGYLGSVFDRVA